MQALNGVDDALLIPIEDSTKCPSKELTERNKWFLCHWKLTQNDDDSIKSTKNFFNVRKGAADRVI